MSGEASNGSKSGGFSDGHGPDPQRYFARQLSDLDFNQRLLDLVDDPEVPLLERVKFLILTSERIDEFYQVQVAGLKRQVVAGIKTPGPSGRTPEELLGDVRASMESMVRRQESLLVNELNPALKAEGIELSDWDTLGDDDRARPLEDGRDRQGAGLARARWSEHQQVLILGQHQGGAPVCPQSHEGRARASARVTPECAQILASRLPRPAQDAGTEHSPLL